MEKIIEVPVMEMLYMKGRIHLERESTEALKKDLKHFPGSKYPLLNAAIKSEITRRRYYGKNN